MKRIFTTTLLISLTVGAYLWVFQNPVSMTRLKRLEEGMSQNDVKRILGEPTKTYGDGQWTYTKPLVFGFVNIHWKEDDTYVGEYNYERF